MADMGDSMYSEALAIIQASGRALAVLSKLNDTHDDLGADASALTSEIVIMSTAAHSLVALYRLATEFVPQSEMTRN